MSFQRELRRLPIATPLQRWLATSSRPLGSSEESVWKRSFLPVLKENAWLDGDDMTALVTQCMTTTTTRAYFEEHTDADAFRAARAVHVAEKTTCEETGCKLGRGATDHMMAVWCSDGGDEVVEPWHSEGAGNSPGGWRSMGGQSMRAMRYLEGLAASKAPLAVEDVLEAHAILMRGSRDVRAGELRTTECSAGDWQFAAARAVPERLRGNLDEFDRNLATQHPVEAAIKLFLDVITTHPFENGNGRLSRLLFNYALSHAGCPFPVALTSGHYSESYMHYIRSIQQAQRNNHDAGNNDRYPLLRSLAWTSVGLTFLNFEDFAR